MHNIRVAHLVEMMKSPVESRWSPMYSCARWRRRMSSPSSAVNESPAAVAWKITVAMENVARDRALFSACVSTDCVRAAAFFSFEMDKSRPPYLEALRDK